MSSARDKLRAAVMATQPNRRETIEFNGHQVEVRQPNIRTILALGESGKFDAVSFLIGHAYVPGTDEKLFEEADRDGLLNKPFGEDFRKIVEAMNKVMNIDVKEAAKN